MRIFPRKKTLRWLTIATAATAFILFRFNQQTSKEDKKPVDRFTVVKVLDGDTVDFSGGDRLRLMGIDTPERGEPYHDEAVEFLSNAALGKSTSLEYGSERRDKYGRLLGYLFVDSQFVNEEILANGLAYVYIFKETDKKSNEMKRLISAQRDAIERKLGLWSIPRTPESYYVAQQGSFRLHRPSCRLLAEMNQDRSRRIQVRNEALATGLSPCRTCKP
jgi:micrococcal nuclease